MLPLCREHLDATYVDLLRVAWRRGPYYWERAVEAARQYVEELVRPARGSDVADDFLAAIREIEQEDPTVPAYTARPGDDVPHLEDMLR